MLCGTETRLAASMGSGRERGSRITVHEHRAGFATRRTERASVEGTSDRLSVVDGVLRVRIVAVVIAVTVVVAILIVIPLIAIPLIVTVLGWSRLLTRRGRLLTRW